MKALITKVVDESYFLELQKHYAQNVIIGFARLNGRSVGIVANQPQVLAGCFNIEASKKAARFIRFCDCLQYSNVSVWSTSPGFLPGTEQEWNGIITHGAKLLYAYSEATVPVDHRDHAESLRRRLYCDGIKTPRLRYQPRIPDSRNRGDGSRRCSEHHPSRKLKESKTPTRRERS